jgi:diguanylate cyclase (GGDEF)-like protein
MSSIHPLTLSFRENTLEQAFSQSTLKRTRHQGQTAIVVGIFVYLLAGIIDKWFMSPEHTVQVWMIRLTALCVPTIVFAVALTPWFARLCHPLLAAVGLAAGVGLIGIQIFVTTENSAYYYPLMVLATFYTYNFVGTRFIFALGVDLFLLVTYNLLFGWVMDYPLHILAIHDFFIVSANLIGGSAGYIAERNRRTLFLREQELENERQFHMSRSLHDGLTGLPNRDLLYDRISQAMAEAQREGSIHCGFFLDLDGFKTINDNLSHKTGDHVLRQVAQRIASVVRSTDTVARIGGDEFFVLALNIGSEDAACGLAKKLIDQFHVPISGIPEGINLSASIGVCLFPYDGMTVSGLIHYADEAMYRVKNNGKGDYAMAKISGESRLDEI